MCIAERGQGGTRPTLEEKEFEGKLTHSFEVEETKFRVFASSPARYKLNPSAIMAAKKGDSMRDRKKDWSALIILLLTLSYQSLCANLV